MAPQNSVCHYYVWRVMSINRCILCIIYPILHIFRFQRWERRYSKISKKLIKNSEEYAYLKFKIIYFGGWLADKYIFKCISCYKKNNDILGLKMCRQLISWWFVIMCKYLLCCSLLIYHNRTEVNTRIQVATRKIWYCLLTAPELDFPMNISTYIAW